MEYVIEMLDIRKEFGSFVANDNITLQLRPQEIHALLGENGAGKSTLMSVLFGLYSPDGGEIRVRGEKVNITNPNLANELGIGMVHQHFKLIHNFTVTENIILGMETVKNGRIDLKTAAEEIAELSKKYNLNVDPNAKIEDISVGMQQRVEILKMLYRHAEILIFDEPTAVLTPQEIDELMQIMKRLVKEGKSIIVITHKLAEIKEVADRCTVIRRGKYIDTVDVATVTENQLAALMVGREVNFVVEKGPATPKAEVLKIENLTVQDARGLHVVDQLSLTVREGEIVGIAGIDGNGQEELVEAIAGLRKVQGGTIHLSGTDLTKLPVRKRTQTGIAHIPADRHKHGLVLDFTLSENMVLQNYYEQPYSKHGILNPKAIAEYAERLTAEFDVRSAFGIDSTARSMSGGNQQKAIIAREVDRSPNLLIASQPTRGLDVGAIEFIHSKLIEERDKNRAVLLISFELDEVLNVSDRIAVICEGKIVAILDADKTNERELGYLMAGGKYEGGMNHE
ncbi:MAG: ABC transporter ATP-binding protein [Culicoidibacterales bacterium]